VAVGSHGGNAGNDEIKRSGSILEELQEWLPKPTRYFHVQRMELAEC